MNKQIKWVLAHEKTAGKDYRKSLPFYESKEQLVPIKKYISKKSRRILDFGCGSGILGRYIKDNFKDKEVTFLDVNPKQLVAIPKECGKKVKSDLLSYNPKEKFDIVISRLVNPYFEKRDQMKIIKKAYNILNKEGLYINMIPLAKSSLDQDYINKFFYLLEEKITGNIAIKRHINSIKEAIKLYNLVGFNVLKIKRLSLGMNSFILDFKDKFHLSHKDIKELEDYLISLSKDSKDYMNLKIIDGKVKINYPLFLIVAKK